MLKNKEKIRKLKKEVEEFMKFKTKASKMRMRKNTEGNFVECSRDGESDTEECEGEGENSESI